MNPALLLRRLPAGFALLVLAAHFLRAGQPALVGVCLLAPGLLFVPRRWALGLLQALLLGGAAVWATTLGEILLARLAAGAPWLRLLAILGAVALATGLAWLPLRRGVARGFYRADPCPGADRARVAAAALTALGLGAVQHTVTPPLLLAERLVPGLGWLEVFGLALYASWAVRFLLAGATVAPRPGATPRRVWLWRGFSAVLFGQLLLGLAGLDRLLLSGTLHLPVPGLILAGPLYRGGGLFMLLLFGATLLLVGPAWCSHLCYIGAWDDAACRRQRRPGALPRWRHAARLGMLGLVVGLALLLRWLGVSPALAVGLGVALGLGGLAVMLAVSTRLGVMAHCVIWCPLGLVASWAGRLSPFRLRLGPRCTDCGACGAACRYAALAPSDIARRRPGSSCTLCGDCLPACRHAALGYRFPGLSAGAAHTLFLVLVVTLHALFLGLARL